MSLLEDIRQKFNDGEMPDREEVEELLDAFEEMHMEHERLRERNGDLEFHFEAFEHLMLDRKFMLDRLSALGLEVYRVPTTDKSSWFWAWRWRGGKAQKGFERSINALVSAIETLLAEQDNQDNTEQPQT